jgi:hypothetical protein
MSTSPNERRLQGQIAAHTSWGRTENRSARTLPARRKFYESFERKADPDNKMSPKDRAKAAQNLRTLHYQKMAAKSARARRRRGAMEKRETTRPAN